MPDYRFNRVKWQTDSEGSWLMLREAEKGGAMRISSPFLGADGEFTAKLSKEGKRRSLDANRYAWKMMDELAKAVDSTKEEIYREQIRAVGVFRDFHLPENEEKSFCTAWGMLGTGWITERVDFSGDTVTVRAYYGSSRYSVRQMSRLIDNLIQDCRAVGIDTLTPAERDLLLSDWGERRKADAS